MPSLRSRVEAVLFVATEPVSLEQLCAATRETPARVRAALAELRTSLADRGIALREVGGGWRLHAHPACRDDVERFLLPPRTSMSPAALETLAIVAYLQPITRAEIESLRGVNVDGVMKTLEERQLVREVGRKEGVGRPILYGTTTLFLETFGLSSLDELPPLPEDAPRRVDGQLVVVAPSGPKATAVEQIHEAVEGHEADVVPRAQATLEDNVADELRRALNGAP